MPEGKVAGGPLPSCTRAWALSFPLARGPGLCQREGLPNVRRCPRFEKTPDVELRTQAGLVRFAGNPAPSAPVQRLWEVCAGGVFFMDPLHGLHIAQTGFLQSDPLHQLRFTGQMKS